MNRQYWLEFLPLSEPLGPLSDQFERLAVAAKYGFYVIDFSGHVFYLTEGGYSRSNTPDWPIETVNRLLMMARLISHPQLKVYFPRHLRNQLSEVWSDMAMRNLHRDVARPFYEATANLYSAFDRLSMNGKLTAKAIGKLIGIARNCQLNWLKHCLLMKFKLAMG